MFGATSKCGYVLSGLNFSREAVLVSSEPYSLGCCLQMGDGVQRFHFIDVK